MKIKITHDGITPKVKKAEAIFYGTKLIEMVGVVILRDVQDNIRTQGSNIGENWPPLSDATLMLRRKGKRSGKGALPLRSTNKMFQGLHTEIEAPTRVVIMSDSMVGRYDLAEIHDKGAGPWTPSPKQRAYLHYLGIHLSKGKKLEIPARKFAKASKKAKDEITQSIPGRIKFE